MDHKKHSASIPGAAHREEARRAVVSRCQAQGRTDGLEQRCLHGMTSPLRFARVASVIITYGLANCSRSMNR